MVEGLLLRGMLVGVVAAVIAFGFARIFGEPEVDRAIAFEEQIDRTRRESREPEIVGRPTQAGLGLFTGVVVYSAALGGLFSLAFACVYGRFGHLSARSTATLLALAGFVSIVLVHDLKFPPDPPSIGRADTIGSRTALFFAMTIISVAALIFAIGIARSRQYKVWNAALLGATTWLVIIAIAECALPEIDEVPEQFSAVVLWHLRVASIGIHVVLWAIIGLLFGALTERAFSQAAGGRSHVTILLITRSVVSSFGSRRVWRPGGIRMRALKRALISGVGVAALLQLTEPGSAADLPVAMPVKAPHWRF
jgi:predicted cobalt transporter CbtA